MAVLAVNIVTGAPLLALWIGSRVQGSGPPSMAAIIVVAMSMLAISLVLAWMLAQLGARHDRLTGRTATVRTHVPWLRSMRGERPVYPGESAFLTVLEQILVIVVMLTALAFNIWFFFFAGSQYDQVRGRQETGKIQ